MVKKAEAGLEAVQILKKQGVGITATAIYSKILAASFKNIAQVNNALVAGAQTVTLPPGLLHDAFGMAAIQKVVDDFATDWKSVYGKQAVIDLAE